MALETVRLEKKAETNLGIAWVLHRMSMAV